MPKTNTPPCSTENGWIENWREFNFFGNFSAKLTCFPVYPLSFFRNFFRIFFARVACWSKTSISLVQSSSEITLWNEFQFPPEKNRTLTTESAVKPVLSKQASRQKYKIEPPRRAGSSSTSTSRSTISSMSSESSSTTQPSPMTEELVVQRPSKVTHSMLKQPTTSNTAGLSSLIHLFLEWYISSLMKLWISKGTMISVAQLCGEEAAAPFFSEKTSNIFC